MRLPRHASDGMLRLHRLGVQVLIVHAGSARMTRLGVVVCGAELVVGGDEHR